MSIIYRDLYKLIEQMSEDQKDSVVIVEIPTKSGSQYYSLNINNPHILFQHGRKYRNIVKNYTILYGDSHLIIESQNPDYECGTYLTDYALRNPEEWE